MVSTTASTTGVLLTSTTEDAPTTALATMYYNYIEAKGRDHDDDNEET